MSKPIKHLPMLPAERALKVIGGRWKAVILYQLFDGPKRLSELERLLPHASQKMLIQQLREMQGHGLLTREVYAQVPPRVDYAATPLGLSLRPILTALCEWGRLHAHELNEVQRLAVCEPAHPGELSALTSELLAASVLLKSAEHAHV